MTKPKSRALIVLLKNAIVGHTKTRLAAGIGDQAAYDGYLLLLEKVKTLANNAECLVYLYYSQHIPDQDGFEGQHILRRVQAGNDLGQRMSHAFGEVCAMHDSCLIIGSDCPYIEYRHIDQAFTALETGYDIAFGPSMDGGYYLLGMTEVHEYLFADIPWSTDAVLTISQAKCAEHGHKFAELEALEDIDDIESWSRYKYLTESYAK